MTLPSHVAGGAADGLHQRWFRCAGSLPCRRREWRRGRHSGNVEAFAQQVDADEHVKHAQAQIADDLNALHRLDVRMQVAHAHTVVGQILSQVLRHALGQRRDEHAVAQFDARTRFAEQIVDLGRYWTYLDLGIDQPGRSHEEFHHAAVGLVEFILGRRGRDEDGTRRARLPFLETQGPIVQRRRQPEAEFDQGFPCANGHPCTCRRVAARSRAIRHDQ